MDTDILAQVTPNMALYVHESLQRPPDADRAQFFEGLILKMFGATKAGAAQEMRLTKDELWLLQTVAKGAGSVGTEKVGQAWLKIVSEGLLRLEAQDQVHVAEMAGRR